MFNFFKNIFSITISEDKHIVIIFCGLKLKIRTVYTSISRLYHELDKNSNYIKNIYYEIADEFNINSKQIKIPKIMTLEETIDTIIENNLSVSRYGDGEFKYMIGGNNLKNFYFGTDFSESLQKRLTEVIQSNKKNHMVCIFDYFGSLQKYNDYGQEVARYHMPNLREIIYKYIDFDKKYGNLNITRPYIIYKDKSHCSTIFNKMKKIWENKDIVIIEGVYTKLGIGNNLFNNVKSIQRILCPAENAWIKYDDIYKQTINNVSKDKLILISLGMSATILAYDLSKVGYQAIDIGHIDIEYEWFLNNEERPVVVKGKYTNDAKFGGGINKKCVPTYKIKELQEQIIAIIGDTNA